MPATLTIWLQLLGLLAAETAVIVALCAQLARLARSAIWRRTIWQACVVGVALLASVELTGTARGLFGWTVENANATKRGDYNQSANVIPPARRSHPLPGGEGRGEGERKSNQFMAREQVQTEQQILPARSSWGEREKSASFVSASPHPVFSIPHAQEPANDPLPLLGLGLAWMTGVSVVLGRILFSRIAFGMLWWKRRKVAETGLLDSAEKLAALLGVRRRVRLLES